LVHKFNVKVMTDTWNT